MADNDVKQALARLQALCSRGEKCIFDVQKKLTQWGINPDDSASVIQSLLNDKYIDEQRFANAFVRDKSRFSNWGVIKIRMALQAKNIAPDTIKTALNEIEADSYLTQLTDQLQKKIKTIKYKSPADLKTKLLRFALSRGFEYSSISSLVNKTVSDYLDVQIDDDF